MSSKLVGLSWLCGGGELCTHHGEQCHGDATDDQVVRELHEVVGGPADLHHEEEHDTVAHELPTACSLTKLQTRGCAEPRMRLVLCRTVLAHEPCR